MSLFRRVMRKIVSAVSAAVMAFSCAAGCISSASASEQPDYNAMAEEIAILVNEARSEAGLKPLYMVPYLNDVANVRARECIETFSHNRPNGESFITALDTNLVSFNAVAENIAAGCSTAEATFNQWKNSEQHWKSIMNPDYTHIGVGVCYEPNSTYRWYWEQFFIGNGNVLEGQYLPERYKVVPVSFGDVNGDGCVDIYDYILLIKYKADEVVLNDLQIESADCMRDGAITIADAIVLKKYIFGMYDTLPIYP